MELSIPFAVEALLGADGTSLGGGLGSPMIEGSSIDSPTGHSAFSVSSLPLMSPLSSNWSTYALSFSCQKANPDLRCSQILGPLLSIRTHHRVSSIFILLRAHQPLMFAKPKPALRPPESIQLTNYFSVPSILDSALGLLLSPAGEVDVRVSVAASSGRGSGSGS